MACLFIEGFDKYGPANSNVTAVNTLLGAGEWTTATGLATTLVAGLSATGQAVSIQYAAASGILNKTLGAGYSRLIGGLRFNSNLFGSNNCGISFVDTATSQCTITINTTGTISLRNAGNTGTALATSTTTISANSTHYLEWDIAFGNSAAYQVWLDGASLFSGTGDTTATANNSANVFVFLGSVSGQTIIYDDLYLFDTTGTTNNAVLLTSPRVETTFPVSDSAVQFAFGAGILGSNITRTVIANGATLANSLYLRRMIPSVSCTVSSIGLMPGTSAAANYRGVIYADSAGAAGTLMSSGSTITGSTLGTALTLPLTTPQALVAGTAYWLGFMTDTAVSAMPLFDNNNNFSRVAATFASGAPGTAGAMTSGQTSYLFWGNLSAVTSANWYEVSQQPPPGLLSYVFDATVGHEDLYNFPALSVPPTAIYAVAVKGNMQKSDAGAKTVSLRTKSGATDGAGSLAGQALGTSFQWLSSYFEIDPNGGIPWTGANLNAATSGFRVDS